MKPDMAALVAECDRTYFNGNDFSDEERAFAALLGFKTWSPNAMMAAAWYAGRTSAPAFTPGTCPPEEVMARMTFAVFDAIAALDLDCISPESLRNLITDAIRAALEVKG